MTMISTVAIAVSQIVGANNHAELHKALQSSVECLDFATYNLSCHKQSKQQFMMEPTLTTWSRDDLASYDAEQWYDRDPLLAYAASDAPPKAWASSDWRGSSQFVEYADYLDQVGIRGGVTAPLANRPGAISAITTLSFSKTEFTNEVADAVYVIGHAAMMRAEVIGLVTAIRNYRPADIPGIALLSKEQLDILDWVAKGKSNMDIAAITNSSRRTVAYHVSEILRKLGVASRSQAALAFGASQGQIGPDDNSTQL